jgi:hypothetical protein
MPKPMIITVAVEEIAFGKIYRWLDATPGVVSLSYRVRREKQSSPTDPTSVRMASKRGGPKLAG